MVLKRAQYFLLCNGKQMDGLRFKWEALPGRLTTLPDAAPALQYSLFDAKGA